MDFIPVTLGTTEGFPAEEWCDKTCVSVTGCSREGSLEMKGVDCKEAAGGH